MAINMLKQFGAMYERGAVMAQSIGGVGHWLTIVRGKRSMREVAEAHNINHAQVRHIEEGKASLKSIQAYADKLGYEIKFILVKKEDI